MVSTPPAGGVAAHACLADERTIAVCPVQTSDRRSERSCRRNDYRRQRTGKRYYERYHYRLRWKFLIKRIQRQGSAGHQLCGYKTQEISIAGKNSLIVTLPEDTETLEEVVVVGYGAQKKESVVGAISQVSSKELLSSPAANVSQAIAGKISGVITTQTSGAPGSDDTQINIRGRATFAGDGSPLILVDGVERSFSQIAPDDIESISVLKDASATAVYGVRGANGVMLITTKRGKEQKPEVNLTANWQIQSPTRKDTYLDSYQSVTLLEEALANDGLPSQFSANDIEMYRKSVAGQLNGLEAMLYPNVDWYDQVLKSSAPAQRYNVSVRGGTKRMRYYASGEFYDQKGLVKNLSQDMYGNSSSPSYRRYAFRANMDLFLTKDLTFSVNFGTRFEERRGSNTNESNNYSETFYELNHTPGWLFPVSYEVQNGESTVPCMEVAHSIRTTSWAGWHKEATTVLRIPSTKPTLSWTTNWDGSPKVSAPREWSLLTMTLTTSACSVPTLPPTN